MGEANINRGKKWYHTMAKADFEGRKEDVEWLEANEGIQADIKEYVNSLPKEETKSKGKK